MEAEVERAVREAVKVYQSLGAKVKEVSLPHSKYGVAAYYIVAPSEASSNLARYDGVHYGHRTDEAAMQADLDAPREAGRGRQPGSDRRRWTARWWNCIAAAGPKGLGRK